VFESRIRSEYLVWVFITADNITAVPTP
jgi:hypothetical protein